MPKADNEIINIKSDEQTKKKKLIEKIIFTIHKECEIKMTLDTELQLAN